MKKSTKKNFLVGIGIIVVLAGLIAFILIKNSKENIEDEKNYCTESSRNANMCIEIYEPVCGFPIEKNYSNSCFACMDKSVEYYIAGGCSS